jgi:hypothetical protein
MTPSSGQQITDKKQEVSYKNIIRMDLTETVNEGENGLEQGPMYVSRPQSKFPTRPKLANLILREATAHT